jgi:hypothetical protein
VRWKKVVIGAVLGGLLGFGGQFVVDFLTLHPVPQREKEDGTLDWKPGGNSIYSDLCSCEFDEVIRRYLRKQQWSEAHKVVCQAALIIWLKDRGDLAARTALIVAFLGASAALALGQKGKNSAVRSSSMQTSIATTPVAELKDNASQQEPVEKPAQIEMTEQAAY